MIVALCYTKRNVRGKYLLDLFADGVRAHGDEPRWIKSHGHVQQELAECDVAMQVCTANKKHRDLGVGQFRKDVKRTCEIQGKRLVIVDTAFVRNQDKWRFSGEKTRFNINNPTTYRQFDEQIYYEVGFDGLKRHAAYYNENSPRDRWLDLMMRLGVELTPWQIIRRDGYILLLGQTSQGASTQEIELYRWYYDMVTAIRKITDRPIMFRQHPRLVSEDVKRNGDIIRFKKICGTFKNVELMVGPTLKEALVGAYASVVYSSNAAIDSVLAGVPTFVGGDICMAWEVGNHHIEDIEKPLFLDRWRWCYDLAFAQWNCAEIRAGTCWEHLRPHATKRPGDGRRTMGSRQ